MNAPDGDNARGDRIIFTGDDGLKLSDYIGADSDGIDEVFRMSAVAAFSVNLNMEKVVGGAGGAFFHSDGADGNLWGNVEADEHIGLCHGGEAAVDELFGTASFFFRGLEQKHHIAAKLILNFGKYLCTV